MKILYRFLLVLFILFYAVTFSDIASAQDARALAKDISTDLRKAQNLSFSGKNSESEATLNKVDELLKQLKEIDPDNSQLKSFERQVAKQRSDLDRKTKSSGTRPSVSGSASKVAGSNKNESKANAGNEITGTALIALKGMIGHLDRAEKTMEAGTGDLGKGSLKRADERYQEIQKKHSTITDHPDVVAAKERHDSLLSQLARAEVAREQNQALEKENRAKQREMIAENEKIIETYTGIRSEKYLRDNPDYIPEAKKFLEKYNALNFPLGRPAELESGIKSLEREIAAAEQNATSSEIELKWLPRIQPFITHNDPQYIAPMGPDLNNTDQVAQMEKSFEKAKKVLAEYDGEFPDGESTHQLKRDIDKLRSAVSGYQENISRKSGNIFESVKNDLDFELAQFKKNDSWNPQSSAPIHVLQSSTKIRVEDNLKTLKTAPNVEAQLVKKMESDFADILQLDKKWRERRTAWENEPKPFPEAGMTSASLLADIEKILKDRGIWPVKKVVIVDKDWWVQKGEFRYVKTAVRQKEKGGDVFRYIHFRQLWTATGYGPTELWRQGDKIKVAK